VSERRSRRAPVLGIAAVAIAAAVIAAFVTTRSSPIRPASTPGPGRPTTPVVATTLPEPAVPIGQPEAPTVPPASASSASAAVVVPSGAPVLTAAGAVLTPPSTPLDRPAPVVGCADLGDTGWTVTSCGNAGEAPLFLTWVVETEPVGSTMAHRVIVWRPATDGQYEAALVATDDQGTVWSSVGAAVATVSTAGGEQLLVGFHVIATGALDWDLVDSPGRVVVHREERGGAAVVSPGQLDAWAASPARGDPACCPSMYVHEVIRNTDGSWRLVLATRTRGPAPASQV
jgi:hypothetical protein